MRKFRFGLRNKGKSGGGRAIYPLMLSDDVSIMLKAYAKSEQSDLSPSDRKFVLNVIKEFLDG